MGISIWQLLIVLVIVLLLFGTKRLRNLGGDLGGAIKGFKKAISEDEQKKQNPEALPPGEARESEPLKREPKSEVNSSNPENRTKD